MLFIGHFRLLAWAFPGCKHQRFRLIVAFGSPQLRHNVLAWVKMWHYLGSRTGGKAGSGTGISHSHNYAIQGVYTYA